MSFPITLHVAWAAVVLVLALFVGRGRRFARYLEPLVWFGLAAFATAAIVDLRASGAVEHGWLVGDWADALAIGARVDEAAVAIVISVLCFLAILAARARWLENAESEGIPAISVLLSATGVVLAWTASTGWLAFLGITLTLVAGLLILGGTVRSPEGSEYGARVLREKSWALLVAMAGACAIGGDFSWTSGIAWNADLLPRGGAFFLCVGVAWLGQPIPFLSSSILAAEIGGPRATVMGQLVPSLAAFSLLFRFEPQLRAVGVLPAFGWYPMATIVFAVTSGISQRSPAPALAAWLAATWSLALSALAFAGRFPAIAILVAGSASVVALSVLLGSAARVSKMVTLLIAGTGIGLPGSFAAAGAVSWLAAMNESIPMLAVTSAAFFAVSMAGWRVALSAQNTRQGSADWRELALGGLALAPALGVGVTGKIFAGAWKGDEDALFVGLLGPFVEAENGRLIKDAAANLTGIWLHAGILIAALGAAYALHSRSRKGKSTIERAFPALGALLMRGFPFDAAGSRAMTAVSVIGRWLVWAVDFSFWGKQFPRLMSRLIDLSGRALSQADDAIVRGIERAGRVSIVVPAKALQLIQSGDVQWYLFFGLGCGVALLTRFFRAGS